MVTVDGNVGSAALIIQEKRNGRSNWSKKKTGPGSSQTNRGIDIAGSVAGVNARPGHYQCGNG